MGKVQCSWWGFFVKNQVKEKIRNLKSEKFLYKNVPLNFTNVVPKVVFYLEDSGLDSILPPCSRSKKAKYSGNKDGTLDISSWTNETQNDLYHIFNSWIYLMILCRPATIITQFAEIKFYLFFTSKRKRTVT